MARWYCIPPANYLFMMEDWHTHMVIAPHMLHNKKYHDFYVDHPDLYTMLDNGLWEGEVVSNSKLLALAELINANEIIAPDHKSGKITIRRTKKFLDYLGEKRWRYKIHGAVHGSNEKQQLVCLEELLKLDLDIISMPKMLGPEMRRKMIARILEEPSPPEVHFLGYYKEEWDTLKSNKIIRSFDTSVPFKPRYNDKFELELPFTWWTFFKFMYRTNKWKRMFYDFKTTTK